MGVEAIKRQTRAEYGYLASRSKSLMCTGLSLYSIGCMPALSVTYSASAAAAAAFGAI